MFMVYWTTIEDGQEQARSQVFDSSAMLDAMACMEQLRKQQRSGEAVRFITMCSENPDSVGHPGVDVTGPAYDWKKRRR